MKKEKKQIRLKVVVFWAAFLAITALFLGFFLSMAFKQIEFKDMDDVSKAKLMITDLQSPSETTYYVYLYSEKSSNNLEKRQEVEASVLNYFSFVRANKGDDEVVKIYAYNVDKYASIGSYKSVYNYLQSLDEDLKQANMPALIKMTDGEVTTSYTTINTIQKELQSAMN